MQKNKTIDWKNTRLGKELLKAIEEFIPMPYRQGMIEGYISLLLSQERKQWEEDLREKIALLEIAHKKSGSKDDSFSHGLYSGYLNGLSDIISLLESKEES